ncbi:MAG: hypothetical protein KAH86_10375 [Methanosarcinales archaeon]|nr:hypothetical protein [Methanosarcinales archaeon]
MYCFEELQHTTHTSNKCWNKLKMEAVAGQLAPFNTHKQNCPTEVRSAGGGRRAAETQLGLTRRNSAEAAR